MVLQHPINGLVQDYRNSSVLTIELLQSCTRPCYPIMTLLNDVSLGFDWDQYVGLRYTTWGIWLQERGFWNCCLFISKFLMRTRQDLSTVMVLVCLPAHLTLSYCQQRSKLNGYFPIIQTGIEVIIYVNWFLLSRLIWAEWLQCFVQKSRLLTKTIDIDFKQIYFIDETRSMT